MDRRNIFLALLLLNSFHLPNSANAQANPTPDNWQCPNPIGGSWVFGQAPNACDISPFANPSFLTPRFGMLFFQEANAGASERTRYMRELFAVLRDAADYYIVRRKPGVSEAEKSAWQHAVLAVANQESFFTHYRLAPGPNLKMMRGDFGHGHGLMQVDDRWHFANVQNGKAAELIGNIIIALDEFYSNWQAAGNASCVGSSTNFLARTRAAYSAYNGGPSQICRWTNPSDPWARNDSNYLEKWNNSAWLPFIDDIKRTAAIDVRCYAEGATDCANPGVPALKLDEQTLYKTNKGTYCLFASGKLSCITNVGDAPCLAAKHAKKTLQSAALPADAETSIAQEVLDRHELCVPQIIGLKPVGSVLKLKKAIYLRATPGGTILTTLPSGVQRQALDFVVSDINLQYRYYRVEYNGSTGYFFGGDASDSASWAAPSTSSITSSMQSGIALTGGKVATQPGFLNLRESIGGPILTALPSGTIAEVKQVKVRNDAADIYYNISTAKLSGWIYGGQILPSRTTDAWVRLR